MRRFAMTMTSKGQVTLPAEFMRAIGVGPGDRLSLLVGEDGCATLAKDIDDLSSMQTIARRVRATGTTHEDGDDPVGDYLVVEDERTKSPR